MNILLLSSSQMKPYLYKMQHEEKKAEKEYNL